MVAHHLVVDGVSWRILVPDLAAAWETEPRRARNRSLPAVGTSMRRWAHALTQQAHTQERIEEVDLWLDMLSGPDPLLGSRPLDPAVDVDATVETVEMELPAEATKALLTTLPEKFHGGVNDGLLTALAIALTTWRQKRGIALP